MNEELQKQLAAMLSKLTDVTGSAASWVGDQIPPLVQEKIIYGRVQSGVLLVLSAVAIWVSVKQARRFYAIADADRAENRSGYMSNIWPERPGGIASIAFSCAAIVAGGVFLDALNTFVLVWFAPRLYIVEWLRGMV